MALSMLSHYPDRARLVTAMSELAAEDNNQCTFAKS